MAVYPPNMAPVGVKNWENAFQTIPDFSFFDINKIWVGKKLHRKISVFAVLVRFSRSCGETGDRTESGVKCCSRYAFPEVHATKNHRNLVRNPSGLGSMGLGYCTKKFTGID